MAGLSQHPEELFPEDEGSSDTSPESTAVARGAARTAATSAGRSTGAVATRGAMAGRLPQTAAAKASKTLSRGPKLPSVPRPPPPRVMPRGAPRHFPKGATPRPTSLPKMKAPRPSSSSVRVPRARVPKSTSSAAPKLSSRIPKARTNTIARATDRASMGFDALSAGFEQNEHKSDTTRKQDVQSKSNAQWMKSMTRGVQQIASFGKVFITNTILGMAVFATYEGIIDHVAPVYPIQDTGNLHNYENTEDDSITNDMLSNSSPYDDVDDDDCANSDIEDNQENHMHIDAMDRATLPQHFLAGAAGGAAHAILSLALEVKVNASLATSISSMKQPNHTLQQTKPLHLLQLPSMMYSASSICHHSLAHSVLFGSYQLTKRALLQYFPQFDSTNNTSTGGISDNNMHIASIAIAGGIAGQMQHVTSHFTEQWLGLEEGEMKQSSSAFLRRMKVATWPTLRSTLVAFPPSAIGFVAFEYGKLMISSDDVDGG